LLTGYVKNRRTIDADIITECTREIKSWYNSNAMFAKNAFQRIIAGAYAHFKALPAPPAAAQLLRKSLKQLGKTKEVTTKGLHFIYGALAEKVVAVSRGLSGKYRRSFTQAGLLAGLTCIVLVLASGVLKVTDSGDTHSLSEQRKVSTVGPTSNISWSPEEDKTEPGSKGPVASVGTDGIQTSRQETAPETKTSDPVPLPKHEAAPPVDAHEQPDPVALAEAALGKKDYQKALVLLAAHQGSPRGKDSHSSVLYAEALVGRAGEIIASTPLEAESMLWKAVEIVPDNAKAYLVLGKRYTRIKDYPRAIDVYRKAVHLDPLMADAFFNLGYIYATLGKYEAAEEAFSRVVRLKPPYLDKSLFNLAVVQQKLGKKTESLSNLEQAVTLGLESKKALAYLSRLKQAGGKNTPVSTR
jgi:tetratricopeptide (TPR) repeat protein